MRRKLKGSAPCSAGPFDFACLCQGIPKKQVVLWALWAFAERSLDEWEGFLASAAAKEELGKPNHRMVLMGVDLKHAAVDALTGVFIGGFFGAF